MNDYKNREMFFGLSIKDILDFRNKKILRKNGILFWGTVKMGWIIDEFLEKHKYII